MYLRCRGTDGRWITPGPNTTGRPLRVECAQQRAHPADSSIGARLVGADQHHLRQLALADVGCIHQWQAVTAWPVDEVVRTVGGQRLQQRRGVVTQRPGREHLLEDRLAVLEHAQVERHRSRVDAGYPGHMIGP